MQKMLSLGQKHPSVYEHQQRDRDQKEDKIQKHTESWFFNHSVTILSVKLERAKKSALTLYPSETS